jgi:CRISPR-associated protein Cmr6
VPFLSVDGGSWTCYLLGKSGTDLRDAVKYLLKAVADIGIGAKTAAGYGYLTAGVPQIVRGGEP